MTAARNFMFLAFFLYPFYIFPSGGFQIAYVALLLMVGAMVFGPNVRLQVTTPMIVYLVFACYMFLVNGTWFVLTQDPDFIRWMMMSSFSAFVFLTTAMLARNLTERDVRLFIIVIVATLALQLFLVLFDLGRPSYRSIIYFNNPNQLGYFSALAAGTAVILSYLYNLRGLIVPVTVIAATVLSTFSLSKGGIGACVCYCAILLTISRSIDPLRKVLVAVTIVAIGALSYESVLESELYVKFDKRMNGFQPANDDNLEARGYGRILEFPEYLVVGAGEGAFKRFGLTKGELHSYPASILFCYGIVGLALLVLFWIVAIPNLMVAMMMMPLLLYNLTHNGGRVIVLWMLFAFIAARYDRTRASAGAPAAPPPPVVRAPRGVVFR